jgi:uncharacterized protein YndB with AHSA1/START domain
MSGSSVAHASFTIERRYDAAPARVFAAFATEHGKSAWFAGPEGWKSVERVFEFRVGGEEVLKGQFPDGRTTDFRCRYFDIVPDRRIVYAYGMHIDGVRISVSLATIELHPDGSGTRLTVTEQGAFLDGYDDAGSRERGTGWLMDKLGATLQRQA